MIIYYFISLISIISTKINSKNIFNALVLLFIYSIIRVDFGNDYEAYLNLFNTVKLNTLESSLFSKINGEFQEPGFILLNYLMPNYRFVIITTSFITCFTIYKFFIKFIARKYYAMSLVLLFFSTFIFFQLTGLRNAIAINLFILSIVYIDNKKLFYILILLTPLFHFSSIFYVPIALLVLKTNNKKILLLLSLSIFIFSVFFNPLEYIYLFQNFGIVFDHFGSYAAQLALFEQQFSYLIFLFSTFILLVLIHTISKFDHKMSKWENIIMKLSILFILFFSAGAISSRGPLWLYIFFIASPPVIIKYQKLHIKFLYLIAIFAFVGYSFFGVFLARENFQYTDFVSIFKYLL